ncbi:MAG: hypothetical protein R3E95_02750 [Thiolinea sp.]
MPVVSDASSDFQGPLAGFMAALLAAPTAYIMTVPVTGRRLRRIWRNACWPRCSEKAELAVAHDGQRLQPVHALIPVSLLASLEAFPRPG